MRELSLSWNFVSAWTKSLDQNFTSDKRGWLKGKSRHHPDDVKKRIITIRQELENNSNEFYIGDVAIQQQYEEQYHNDPIPGLDYINDILRNAGLSKPHKKKRRGTSKYLGYPVKCIDDLGDHIAEIDFIGNKFIKGHSNPLHFLTAAYRKPPKLRYIQRTESERTIEAINTSVRAFDILGWPDVAKIDNGFPFTGGIGYAGRAINIVSRYAAFLLNNEIIPIYGAPRHSWNQSVAEGSNSVFGRNFWNKHNFGSISEVDERLTAFNNCSMKYARCEKWERPEKGDSFIPRICFIRKVKEDAWKKEGRIEIANNCVIVPKEYINLFTFSEWNLREATLNVYFEQNEIVQIIQEISFQINKTSLKRCTHFIS